MVRELTRPTTRPSLARLDLDEAALKRSPPEDQGQPRPAGLSPAAEHLPGVEGRFAVASSPTRLEAWRPSKGPRRLLPTPRLEAPGAMRVLASFPTDRSRPPGSPVDESLLL